MSDIPIDASTGEKVITKHLTVKFKFPFQHGPIYNLKPMKMQYASSFDKMFVLDTTDMVSRHEACQAAIKNQMLIDTHMANPIREQMARASTIGNILVHQKHPAPNFLDNKENSDDFFGFFLGEVIPVMNITMFTAHLPARSDKFNQNLYFETYWPQIPEKAKKICEDFWEIYTTWYFKVLMSDKGKITPDKFTWITIPSDLLPGWVGVYEDLEKTLLGLSPDSTSKLSVLRQVVHQEKFLASLPEHP